MDPVPDPPAPDPPARLTVLSGPSGVGKSTVVRALRERRPDVWISVSVTTRSPRPDEVEGMHYFFVDDAAFDRLVADGDLLEWARFAGNRYGTPARPVRERLDRGEAVLLEIDLQGARQIRARVPAARLVFLAPPSWDELVRRLVDRGTESAAVVEQRLALAREELAAEPEFDDTLVNSDVDQVCERLLALTGIPQDPRTTDRGSRDSGTPGPPERSRGD